MSDDRNRLIFLMNGWTSSAGGIQTVNRELACAVAKLRTELECVVVVPAASGSERDDAYSRGVTLIHGETKDDWVGILLSQQLRKIPPDKVLGVVGHSYFSGKEAIQLRKSAFPKALGIHFVHMSPLHTEALKEYRQENYVVEREKKIGGELVLAGQADLVFCIGPRLYRSMHDLLVAQGLHVPLEQIACGLSRTDDEARIFPKKPTLLALGRTDSIGVKGLDIFARAAGRLAAEWMRHPSTKNRPVPQFIVRGAGESPEKLENQLRAWAQEEGAAAAIHVRPYTTDKSVLEADYRGASIFFMSSREEGFGLVACEALSLGVPVLVSSESGFAELVKDVAKKRFMDADRCVVSMTGSVGDISQRYASAALEILVEENDAGEYFNALKERMLPICSWEAGAQQFLKAFDRENTSKLPKDAANIEKTQRLEVQRPEIQSKLHSADAAEALKKTHVDLLSRPGVVAVTTKQAIVVIVEKGSRPNLPAEIDGVEVVVREIESIRLSAAQIVAPGDGLFVRNQRVASIGLVLKDEFSNLYALTVAHAIPEDFGDELILKFRNRALHVALHQIDREKDWALLTLPDLQLEQAISPVYDPDVGMAVTVGLPGGSISGFVTAIEIDVRIPTAPGSRMYRDMFEVQLSGPVLPGTSGAPVLSAEGHPVGIVVASFRNVTAETNSIFATTIRSVLRGTRLQPVSMDSRPTVTVGILASSERTLNLLLRALDSRTRIFHGEDTYFKGKIGPEGLTIIATALPNIGNIGSAIATTKLLANFPVDYVVVVGTCGGLQPSTQKLGDVVISSEIIYYESAAFRQDDISPRIRVAGITPRWISELASEINFETADRVSDEPHPQIHVGSIASGEKLIRDTGQLKALLGQWRSAVAVEMEGAGVAEAVSMSGRDPPVIVIRGIADLSDGSKDDRFRDVAASRSVYVAFELLKKLQTGGAGGEKGN
jgi:5'-methylthioadenosine/S-adenosylhomocysteine nucleosidase